MFMEVITVLIIQSGPKVGIQYIVHSIASSVYLILSHSVYYEMHDTFCGYGPEVFDIKAENPYYE